MDLAQLRAMRKTSSSAFAKITSEMSKAANPQTKSYEDDRFWKLEADKAGNGSAVIRFLPARDDDELPWVKMYTHGFKGPTGKWYIENSLSTIGKEDPVVEENTRLWNTGIEANQNIARDRKRKLSFFANILVISDPKHPENEGKVFVFKFGKSIFDMITDKANPTFEGEEPVDVFNPWEGANFKLRMRKADGFTKFDKSAFEEPSEIGDDEEILRVLNARHRLGEFTDAKNFKSYEELKKKFESVINPDGGRLNRAVDTELESDDPPFDVDPPKAAAKPAAKSLPARAPAAVIEDDDDDLASFRSLLDE